MQVTRYHDVRTVLADPAFTVPPPPEAGAPGGIAWLRASVARFSTGAPHRRRRALASDDLRGMDPNSLRRSAFARSAAALAGAGATGRPVELMALVARVVPVGLLLDALEASTAPELTSFVATVARAYQPGTEDDGDADHAVARLVRAFGGSADERTAARIGLLIQACDATAGLIGNAILAALRRPADVTAPSAVTAQSDATVQSDPEAILTETLRHDPPVRATSRIAVAPTRIGGTGITPGTLVRLDLAAANRDPEIFADPDRFDPHRFDPHRFDPYRFDPYRDQHRLDSHRAAGAHHVAFGGGSRPCPGRDHATAIAVGAVAAVLAARPGEPQAQYEAHPNLRVPARLWVSLR